MGHNKLYWKERYINKHLPIHTLSVFHKFNIFSCKTSIIAIEIGKNGGLKLILIEIKISLRGKSNLFNEKVQWINLEVRNCIIYISDWS